MRIVFLGLPLAAILLIADGHSVPLAGLRKGLTMGARRLRRLMDGPSTVVIDPHRNWASFENKVRALQPDLLVSWFFTRKIPQSVVQACRLGGIGVHPSLLPRYRGPDPFYAVLDAGDTHTGVTVHRIEPDYDTGAILEQVTVDIDPRWNAWQLARRLDGPSLQALRSVVRRAAGGDLLEGTPQDERLATYAPAPSDDDRIVRWSEPAERVVRRIRALSPTPGAVAWVDEHCLIITRAERCTDLPRALLPGEATLVRGTMVVRAADAGVAILEAEIDGRPAGPSDLAMLVAQGTPRQ